MDYQKHRVPPPVDAGNRAGAAVPRQRAEGPQRGVRRAIEEHQQLFPSEALEEIEAGERHRPQQ